MLRNITIKSKKDLNRNIKLCQAKKIQKENSTYRHSSNKLHQSKMKLKKVQKYIFKKNYEILLIG